MTELRDRLLKESGALQIQDSRGYGEYHLGYSFTNESLNKYTELVVQQCVSLMALTALSNWENADVTWTADTAIQQISDRFAWTRPVEGPKD